MRSAVQFPLQNQKIVARFSILSGVRGQLIGKPCASFFLKKFVNSNKFKILIGSSMVSGEWSYVRSQPRYPEAYRPYKTLPDNSGI